MNNEGPIICPSCRAGRSQLKGTLLRRSFIGQINWAFKAFFFWAKLTRKTAVNPTIGLKSIPVLLKIQHYQVKYLSSLLQYASNPQADPTEALMLFLVLVHCCTNNELRYMSIPVTISLTRNRSRSSLADCKTLLFSPTPLSRGRRTPQRATQYLRLSREYNQWLIPLLKRFEAQRLDALGNASSSYLFVTKKSGHKGIPVSPMFILRTIYRGSRRALGSRFAPSRLRKTMGILLGDRYNPSFLTHRGWKPLQAFRYGWLPREVVQPKV